MKDFGWQDFWNFLKIAGASVGFIFSARGFIALIDLYRHRKEDLAKARKMNAEADLLQIEKKSEEFKLSTEILQSLNRENENSRNQLEAAHNEIYKLRGLLAETTSKLNQLEKELQKAEEKNRECAIKIEELEVELSRLRRDGHRPT